MNRTSFRNIMILVLLVCFGVTYFAFRKTQAWQLEITEQEGTIVRLNQELENARNLNVALTELDNLTITEQTATQLDILRHLNLEQSELDFGLEARDVMTVGGTSLYAHGVRIGGKMPYEAAMALADRLQNTKKIVLYSIELRVPSDGGENVEMVLSGKIYGLDKTAPPPLPEPIPAPPATPEVSATTVSATEVSGTEVSGTLVSPSEPTPATETSK